MSRHSEKINETALSELLVVIRRNSQFSACITNFENLLHEIDDPKFINTTVSCMFNFLTEIFELFGAVDRVAQKKFKAKMLSNNFIEPMRFFGKVKLLADKSMKVRAAIELLEGKYTPETQDTDKKPMRMLVDEAEHILNDAMHLKDENGRLIYKNWKELNKNGLPGEFIEKYKELARKEMLLWNYIPAIVKAIVQTKRRSLSMDNNSKKFN